mmetsp:Transcript_31000/g.101052  ORF Transcript_31000/g.101052 Transcript_31000/m.101052 type:complete len:466 (+) Transcript_31000:34-1431(+)
MAAADGLKRFVTKMEEAKCSSSAIAAFTANYQQLTTAGTGMVGEASIESVASLPHLSSLAPDTSSLADYLSRTAVLKLNGGLGTGMGLEKAKSLLPVKDGLTFLDLIAKQVKHMRQSFSADVRFILMNSFSTSDDTKAHLAKEHGDLLAEPHIELMQNMSPKVLKETLEPAVWAADPSLEWCPPGHGDIYASLAGSGMLDELLAAGIEYVFVSNSDNLGATLDPKLLCHFAEQKLPFVMEVCERTEADKKGGHLARRKADGGLLLREAAQCAPEDEAAFQDVSKHKFFNTNNLWVNLKALKETMDANGGALALPLIQNSKTVDPRDKSSPKVLQLETAMGAAIECFEGASAVVVPRERFAPVKTCNDLLSLRSDAFSLTEDFRVVLAAPTPPVVKLDDAHYKLVDGLEAHVDGYPSLVGCSKLTVKGPVRFQAGAVVKGAVTVTNAGQEPKPWPAGTYEDTTVEL